MARYFGFVRAIAGHLDLLLLSILKDGPLHGYAVLAALRDRSAGAFDLPEGTIYPALHRLENAGRLSAKWVTESGRRRKVYRVTVKGGTALENARREWASFAEAMFSILGRPAWNATS